MTETDSPPTIYYKGMLENGLTLHEHPGWFLPRGSRPGKWMPKIQTVELCSSGYHVCTIDQLREWIAPAVYVVEVRGMMVKDGRKSAWQQARLVRRVEGWGMDQMVEWAKACADHVAHLRDTSAYASASYTSYATYAATSAAYFATSAAYFATSAAYFADNASYAAAYASYAAAYAERRWQTDLLKTMLDIEG